MNAKKKICQVILEIESVSDLTPSGKPILIHYSAHLLRGIPRHELTAILEKFAKDEKVIKILKSPYWTHSSSSFEFGVPREIEESFEIKLLPKFKKYASQICSEVEKYLAEAKISNNKKTKAQSDAVGTREKNTLLRMILGMAIKGYRYDPSQNRSDAIKEIVNDLEELGIPVSDDTVRKWLHEASANNSITR